MLTVCIASFKTIGKLQREKLHQSCTIAFTRTHRRMDNSCKWRAYCLYRSFVIIYTECGEWQASLACEKLACLVEVSVTDRFYGNFQNSQRSWGNWACANSVYQALFPPPTHKSLGTRLFREVNSKLGIHPLSVNDAHSSTSHDNNIKGLLTCPVGTCVCVQKQPVLVLQSAIHIHARYFACILCFSVEITRCCTSKVIV